MLNLLPLTAVIVAAAVATGFEITNAKRASTEIGLTASGFAASGLSPEDADEVLARLKASALVDQLISLREQLREHEAIVSESRRKLRDGNVEGLQEIRDILADRLAAVAAVTTSLKDAGNSLFEASVSNLPQEQQDRLVRYRSNGGANLPAEFRVSALTADEIKLLQRALSAEMRATSRGEVIAEDLRLALVEFRGRDEVVSAKGSLDANLSAISLRFEQALK